jgi:hypothetical protein
MSGGQEAYIANGIDEEHVCSISWFFIRHHRVLLNAYFYLSLFFFYFCGCRKQLAPSLSNRKTTIDGKRHPCSFTRQRFTVQAGVLKISLYDYYNNTTFCSPWDLLSQAL